MFKPIVLLAILVALFAVASATFNVGYRSGYYSYPGYAYQPYYGASYGPYYRGYSAQVGVVPAYSSYQPYYQPYYSSGYYGPSYYSYPYASKA